MILLILMGQFPMVTITDTLHYQDRESNLCKIKIYFYDKTKIQKKQQQQHCHKSKELAETGLWIKCNKILGQFYRKMKELDELQLLSEEVLCKEPLHVETGVVGRTRDQYTNTRHLKVLNYNYKESM